MLFSAVLQYPKLAGQKGPELKALVFVSHLGHSGYFINKRYKREACSRCTSNHTESSIVTSFLRISDEQAFVLLPPHPESFSIQICQRERHQIYFGVPRQTKMPNLRAPAQERQHSPSRKSKLTLVHRNILGYKPTASGGPAELSPVTSEKPGPAWEQGALQLSQGKPHRYP